MTESPRDQPFDTGDEGESGLPDYSRIEKKIRPSKLRRDVFKKWGKRGAIGGAVGWVLLCCYIAVQRWVFKFPKTADPFEFRDFMQLLVPFTPFMAFFGAIVAIAAAVLFDSLKPIFLALFADPKRFEREYGQPAIPAPRPDAPSNASVNPSPLPKSEGITPVSPRGTQNDQIPAVEPQQPPGT